jgi:hypothetical protein
MRKITLLMAFVACAMFANATDLFCDFSGKSIPSGWTYITNNPTYPDPGFYTASGTEGLKLNFEGQGMLSPTFGSANTVTVILNITALNENTKTGVSDDAFTITALNASDAVLATQTIGKTAVQTGDNSVTLSGTDIVKVQMIMTGYPNNGTKYCNVNLRSITITIPSGIGNINADKLNVFVANKALMVQGIANGTMVEVYTATGARVLAQELVNGQIQLDNLSKGIYVVRAGNEKCKIVL